jgi:hypothetical protein
MRKNSHIFLEFGFEASGVPSLVNIQYRYLKGQSYENVCEIIALNDRLGLN